MSNNCAFCEENISLQEVSRTLLTKVIYPRKPVVEPAVMIMPIRHCENIHELTAEEQLDIFVVIDKIQKIFVSIYKIEGYNLFVNNGVLAGQHIPHVHFHLFGRVVNEAISPFAILNSNDLYKQLEKGLTGTK
jgi:diadenosine tetraphosphate (Ap4A) HIT family hydrolase